MQRPEDVESKGAFGFNGLYLAAVEQSPSRWRRKARFGVQKGETTARRGFDSKGGRARDGLVVVAGGVVVVEEKAKASSRRVKFPSA